MYIILYTVCIIYIYIYIYIYICLLYYYTLTDSDYTDDRTLLANEPAKTESQQNRMEQAPRRIGFHVNKEYL